MGMGVGGGNVGRDEYGSLGEREAEREKQDTVYERLVLLQTLSCQRPNPWQRKRILEDVTRERKASKKRLMDCTFSSYRVSAA